MLYIALSLGFFGSLHCIGMCGPLALGVSRYAENIFSYGIQYNVGRIFMYAILGAILGSIGGFIELSGFQQYVSIFLGVGLIILFLLSMDLEKFFFKSTMFKNLYFKISNKISQSLSQKAANHPFYMGLLNGILPCGLTYLALTGALATRDVLEGVKFMAIFGLGTFPAMFFLMMSSKLIDLKFRNSALKVFPYLQLFFGVFLIYRGIVVKLPSTLNFWEAIINPVMCH